MTLNEFRACLEGFEDAIESAPTEEQWAKIKAKLATVKEAPKVTLSPLALVYEPRPGRWWEGPICRGA